MNMQAEITILKEEQINVKIKEVTLLSLEEYEKYKDLIPEIDYWYWLRSPRNSTNGIAYVAPNGSTGYDYCCHTSGTVRPALRIEVDNPNSEELVVWEKIMIKNDMYSILDVKGSEVLLLSDGILGYRRFDPKSNIWEKSELKEWLDNWAEEEFER